MFNELWRYYNSARLFRFFIHHPYIYGPIIRDLLEKRLGLVDYVRPRNIVIKLNTACNAKCEFCYAKNEPDSDKLALTLDEWKNLIDQAHDLGCYTVTLTGGEPLLYPHIEEIIRYVRSKGMLAFAATNGLSATPQLMTNLANAGLCAINWSLHGPREHHDRLVRVKGAYDALLEHGEACAKRTTLNCFVNHVLTKESIKYGWYDHVWEQMKKRGFRAMIVLPVCLSGIDKSSLLNEEELKVVDRLAKEDHILMDTKNYSRPMCPAAKEDLLVNNFGECQPCPFIPITFGNVLREPLKDIFLRMQKNESFAAHSEICLAARDHRFIDTYLMPAFKGATLPAPFEKVMKR